MTKYRVTVRKELKRMRIYTAYVELHEKDVIIRQFDPGLSAKVFPHKDKTLAKEFYEIVKSKLSEIGQIHQFEYEGCVRITFDSTIRFRNQVHKAECILNGYSDAVKVKTIGA